MKGKRTLVLLVLLLSICATSAVCSAEPMVKFDHKSMDIHMNMNFRKFQTLERLMPKSMKKEISEDYYPFIRKNIRPEAPLFYKNAKATMVCLDSDRMNITLEFPHYFLEFRDVCWNDMDSLFQKYFAQSRKINKFAVPTQP